MIDVLQEVIEVLTEKSRPYFLNGMSPAQAVAYGAQDYRRALVRAAAHSDSTFVRLEMLNIISPRVPLC